MPRRLLLAALGVSLAGLLAADAAELVIVEDGVSRAPIVAFENAPPKTRRAADELAEYIAKISGARPEVLEGRPDPMPEHAIWVGYQPVLEELFPETDFDFQHPEEILIAANERHLVVAGRDRWDPDTLAVPGRNWTIEGFQREFGTANAVYTFLQDYLHVRWLWPGDLGEDILEQATIAFEPFEYRYHPQFRQRAEAFRFSALGDGRGRSHEWSRFQRLQLDSLIVPGGHGFSTWWNRFGEEHPEYFALQPDGTRSGFPSPGNAKLCLSNPAVWARTISEIEAQLEERPHRTVFNVQENDSHSRGLCICSNCLAWDHPQGAPWRYSWEGLSQEHVAMTDRYITFWNKIEDLLKERFPDRDDLMLAGYAYVTSLPLPVEATLGDRFVFGTVPHFPLTTAAEREEQKAEFKAWSEHAPRIYYRPNLFYASGGRYGLPEVGLDKTIEDWRFLAEHNCMGVYIDGLREHWATLGPQLYLIGKLTWNPYQDGQEVLEDYYQRAFGPAAGELAAYWEAMSQARDEYVELPGYRRHFAPLTRRRARERIYTDEFFEETGRLLDRAAEKVADEPEVFAERVAFVRIGFDFTHLVYESVGLEEAADEGDRAAQQQIAANWQAIERKLEGNPLAFGRWAPWDLARGTMPFAPRSE